MSLSCAIDTVTSRFNRLYPHPQSCSFAGVAPMWVGARAPAVSHAVRRSKHRLVSVAPSEPCVHTLPGNLGPFDKMQRQTLVGDPQPWWRRTDHATSQRPLQGPKEGDEGGGGRIKRRGSGSSCNILPVFERKQHCSSHLPAFPI